MANTEQAYNMTQILPPLTPPTDAPGTPEPKSIPTLLVGDVAGDTF
jgi:hypothetical protein